MALSNHLFRIRFLGAGPVQIRGVKALDQDLVKVMPTVMTSTPILAGTLANAWNGLAQGVTLQGGALVALTWQMPHRPNASSQYFEDTTYMDYPLVPHFIGLQTNAGALGEAHWRYERSDDGGATWESGSKIADPGGILYADDASSFDWWNLTRVDALYSGIPGPVTANPRWRIAVTRIKNRTDPLIVAPAVAEVRAYLGEYSIFLDEDPYYYTVGGRDNLPLIDLVPVSTVVSSGDRTGFPASNMKDGDPSTYWFGTTGGVNFMLPPRFLELKVPWKPAFPVDHPRPTLIDQPTPTYFEIVNPPEEALAGAVVEALLQFYDAKRKRWVTHSTAAGNSWGGFGIHADVPWYSSGGPGSGKWGVWDTDYIMNSQHPLAPGRVRGFGPNTAVITIPEELRFYQRRHPLFIN